MVVRVRKNADFFQYAKTIWLGRIFKREKIVIFFNSFWFHQDTHSGSFPHQPDKCSFSFLFCRMHPRIYTKVSLDSLNRNSQLICRLYFLGDVVRKLLPSENKTNDANISRPLRVIFALINSINSEILESVPTRCGQ